MNLHFTGTSDRTSGARSGALPGTPRMGAAGGCEPPGQACPGGDRTAVGQRRPHRTTVSTVTGPWKGTPA